jgi:8-oxo-dGTP diphosphatase
MIERDHLEKIQVTAKSYESSITTDIAVFGYLDGELKILLTKRKVGVLNKSWLLPGGAMNIEETLEDCANKVLKILTGLDKVHFEQVKVYSKINRHPIKRVLTVCFYALINPENHLIVLGDTVEGVKWFAIENLPSNIGFDHLQLIQDAIIFLKHNLNDRLIASELLQERFTLQELQNIHENILGTLLDRRNFRKRVLQLGIFENTGKKKKGIKGGPFLYKLTK